MVDTWSQREEEAAETPIPIHLVSFGDDIPYAENFLKVAGQENSYITTPGYDGLQAALLPSSETNVLFLNVAPSDYKQHLDANESLIRQRNPLIVAPKEYAPTIDRAVVAKYNIKFISFLYESPANLAKNLQPLLRERAREQSR